MNLVVNYSSAKNKGVEVRLKETSMFAAPDCVFRYTSLTFTNKCKFITPFRRDRIRIPPNVRQRKHFAKEFYPVPFLFKMVLESRQGTLFLQHFYPHFKLSLVRNR